MIVATRPSTESDYRARLLAVQLHIQNHLDTDLPLGSLASVAHFSPYHFHRVFRGMTGETVAQYVRRLRLERAAQRLKHSHRPLPDIAAEAGYDAYESFSRAFRALFDQSPSEFREAETLSGESSDRRQAGSPLDEHDGHDSPPDHPTIPHVTIEHLPERRIIFFRHVGPYDQVGPAWARLMRFAGIRFLIGRNPQMFALVHDDPEVTPSDRIRYDACLVVRREVKPRGDIGVTTLPPADYASTLHTGPYNQLGLTYAALCGRWLPTSGRELAASPGIEQYLNNPRRTPPDQLETRIFMPLEPVD